MLLVRDWLESPRSGAWLMVVDNVDDFATFTETPVNTGRTLYEYTPKSLNGLLLYTTRSRDIGINLAKDVLRVAPMSQPEASSLFSTLSRSGTLEETKAVEECETLCEALGHIPLAISQAAAYMSKTRISVARYTELFSTAETEVRLLSHKFISPGREERQLESVKSTIEISFEVIRTESQRAHDLLCLMGFLDREGIPEYLLTLDTDAPLDFEDAIAHLMAFSLVGKNEYGDIYNIHKLVHVLIGSWLQQKGDTYKWSSQALQTVATKFPNSDFENWEVCAELVPHADCVLGRKYEDPLDIVAQARLLLNLSSYQRRRGRLEIAEILARESLHLREKSSGQRDPDSVRSLNNLASVLLSRGKYEEALRIQSIALKNLEAASGNWNSDILISMENYAGVLQKQGDLTEAESMQRKVLQRQELMLGEEDLNTLRSYCKLASILQEQYMLVEAEDLYRKALPILKTHFGMGHPETLNCMRDLASLLFLRKEDAEAEVLRSQAVAGYEKILGSEHPDTLTSMRNLALEYQRQGRFATAEALHRQILSARERVLGSTHPDTLDSITDLASVLEDEGKYDDAKAVVYSHSANQTGPASFRVPQLQVTADLSKLANEEIGPNSSTAMLTVSAAIKWRKDKSSRRWRLDRKIGVKTSEELIGGYLRDRLRSRDHVFLIDDSSSMSKYWKEVADVLGILAYIVAQNDSDGVDACFSGSELQVHGNNSSQLISTLKRVVPSGEPDIAQRLNQMLHRDFSQRATSRRFLPGGSRPLSLIILTDGNWRKAETQKAIVEPIKALVEKLTSSQGDGKQVGIQFVAFGNDSEGLHKLKSIDESLSRMPLDIVDVEPSNGNVWKMLLGAISDAYDFDDPVLDPVRNSTLSTSYDYTLLHSTSETSRTDPNKLDENDRVST
jgi:tetratricopeptide (TPR) repeat protein